MPRYDLYLISNGNTVTQECRLKSAGIGPYFKGIFISEQIGANKPSRAFFDACFAAIPDGIHPDHEFHALGELPTLLERVFKAEEKTARI